MRATDTERSGIRTGAVRAAALGLLLAMLCAPPAMSAATPQDLVLMLDNSGSMRRNDPDLLTRVAVRAFLDGLDGDYHVAIVSFDQRVNVLMPLTALDETTRARFLASLDAINHSGLLTNSPAALERSLYELREAGRPGARKSIVFMTDGIVDVAPEGADPGDVEKARWMKSNLADEAADNRVRIFGIAFTDNADFELIQTLAKRTAGEYYRAYSAGDIDGVFASIREHLDAAPAPAPSAADPHVAPLLHSGSEASAPEQSMAIPLPREEPATTFPVTRASPPSAELPRARPPQSELPQAELPAVELPVVILPSATLPATNGGGSVIAPTATEAAPARTSHSAAVADRTASAPVAPERESAATGAPPAEDASNFLDLIVGGITLLLALAALTIVYLRRRVPSAAPADPAPVPRAFLNDIDGVTDASSYEIADRPVMIGRLRGPESQTADYIVIDESTVGRQHALIEYKEHAFWITDQNSLNGTFVNNARIETTTRLKHGDRIRFHRHEFEFLVLEMFETDRTMMSDTLFPGLSKSAASDDDDATVVREDDLAPGPSPKDPTITRI